jgi:hypothetical protein
MRTLGITPEARLDVDAELALTSFLYATVLSHPCLRRSLSLHRRFPRPTRETRPAINRCLLARAGITAPLPCPSSQTSCRSEPGAGRGHPHRGAPRGATRNDGVRAAGGREARASRAVPSRVCRNERAAAAVDMVQNIRGSSAKGDSSSSSTSTATGSVLPFSYLIAVSSPSS